MSASTWVLIAVLPALLVYLHRVHGFFREQKKVCGTYPFYRLRDQVIWDIAQRGEQTPEQERTYRTLNRIVHRTDRLGWRFISEVVQDVTRTVLEGGSAGRQPSLREVELVKLVVQTAQSNSLLVRFALSRFGRVALLLPVVKAGSRHLRPRRPVGKSKLFERVETVRRVRRLNHWSRMATAP